MKKKEEYWKPIQGYERSYRISSLGRVQSVKRLRPLIMRLQKNQYGDILVSLQDIFSPRPKTKMVARLVAEHFIPNPNGYQHIDFLDKNKENCCASNLVWCESSSRMMHRKRKPVRQYTIEGVYLDTYDGIKEAEQKTGIQGISGATGAKKNSLSAGGYIWVKESDDADKKALALAKLIRERTPKKRRIFQKNTSGKLIKIWKTVQDIRKENPDYSVANIYGCLNGKRKTAYGYQWEYCDEEIY